MKINTATNIADGVIENTSFLKESDYITTFCHGCWAFYNWNKKHQCNVPKDNPDYEEVLQALVDKLNEK